VRRVLLFLALLLMLASCQNPSRPLPLDALADWPNTGRAAHRAAKRFAGLDAAGERRRRFTNANSVRAGDAEGGHRSSPRCSRQLIDMLPGGQMYFPPRARHAVQTFAADQVH
jgi:hypothetical protein